MKNFLSSFIFLILLFAVTSIKANNADTLNAEGQKLIDQKKYEDALILFKKAITLKPDYWRSYRNAGWVLTYKLDSPKVALAYYQKAIELNPNEPLSFLEIAATYMDLKNWELCAEYYIKALNIYKKQNKEPMGSWIYSRLADILSDRLNRKDETLKYLLEGSKYFKNEPNIIFEIANIYRNKENYSEALKYYNTGFLLAEKQNTIPSVWHLIRTSEIIFYKLKIHHEGIDFVLKKENLYKNEAYFYLHLGGMYSNTLELNKAIEVYNKAILIYINKNEAPPSYFINRISSFYPKVELSFQNAKKILEYFINKYPNHKDKIHWEEEFEWCSQKKIKVTGIIKIEQQYFKNNSVSLALPLNTDYQKHLSYSFEPKPVSYNIFKRFGNTCVELKYSTMPEKVKYTIDILLIASGVNDNRFLESDNDDNPDNYLKLYEDENDDRLKKVVNEIIGTEKNTFNKAKLIHNWIYKNFTYKRAYYDSIHEYLKNKNGECSGYANVFTKLCRVAKIPARWIYGPIFQNPDNNESSGHLGSHVTSEFYIRGKGWIPVNNTNNSFGITSSILSLCRYTERSDTTKTIPYNLKSITASLYLKNGKLIIFKGGDFLVRFL